MRQKRFQLRRKHWSFLAVMLLILAAVIGCTADDEEGQPGAVTTDTAEELPEQAQSYIDMSRAALAEQLGIEESAIELDSITEPATADGTYIILLMVNGESYEYHGRNNEVLLVSDGLPTAPSATAAPDATEVTYTYSPAMVEEVEAVVDVDADQPVQLIIRGQLRNGCEELHEQTVDRVNDFAFDIQLTVSQPEEAVCTEALRPFETTIPVEGMAELPAGEYTVEVNDEITTTFVWDGIKAADAALPAVNFMLDEAVYSGITTETIPAVEGAAGEPFWEIKPTHSAVTLEGYSQSGSIHQAQIFIYPVEALKEVNDAAAIQVNALQRILDTSPDEMSAVMTDTLPYLPLYGATQSLYARVERLDFANGRGLRYLTHFAQAANPISNEELVYTFQGLTNDGAYYIAAVLPVSHPDLPADIEAAPADFDDDYEAYLAGIVEQLENADAASFNPDLSALDQLVTSINVQAPVGSDNGETTAVRTHFDLVTRLEEAGAEVRISTEPIEAADILSIPGNILFVNGEELQVYIYDTAEAAEADAARIAPDASEIASETAGEATALNLDGPPHFYRWDNIIVLYVGENSDMLNLLNEVLGQPFATPQ